MQATELSNRKKAVLEAIVRAYIETGEPVGSKILTSLLDNAPSSATLRNEMNELCALGLLSQPHTSAGRIPTSKGYRLYVSSLMTPCSLSPATKAYIDKELLAAAGDISSMPKAAAKALNRLTGFPAVVCFKPDSGVYLKSAELIAVGARSALLLAVSSDGRAFSRLCSIPSGVSPQLLSGFSQLVEKRLKRLPLKEFGMGLLQNLTASAGINSLDLLPVMAELFSLAQSAYNPEVSIEGAAELFGLFGERQARRLLSLTNREETFISALEFEDAQVIFGNDTGLSELGDKALVLSKYNIKNRYCGKIGIIGQGRMSYEQIIPSIEYTAERLGCFMSAAVSNMED